MKKIAVDLLWVRVGKVGGIESYVRNVLDGFLASNFQFSFFLITSSDNNSSFNKYGKDSRFTIIECKELSSSNVRKRIIWQNLHFGKLLRSLNIDCCFEPYYCKPFLGTKNISFITTIHDLQAIHFPEYFSKFKVMWMKFSWKNTIKSSKRIVAISNYVKNDIETKFNKISDNKIVSIYNPIVLNYNKDYVPSDYIKDISRDKYLFTISSLLPHKNLNTLLDALALIVEKDKALPQKLVISGVGGKQKDSIIKKINDLNLNQNVIITDFLSNDERNYLYKNCSVFVFPSIFEGFGMPVIEAMMFNIPVVTTKETSLYEVSQGLACYVDDPYSPLEFVETIKSSLTQGCANYSKLDLSVYESSVITEKYFELFKEVFYE